MTWREWMATYWSRLRTSWQIASSGVENDQLVKALRSPIQNLSRDEGVYRIGRHRSPYDVSYEPGGEGPRKPWGYPYEVLRSFARKSWALRSCVMIRQREVAGSNWEIVPDLEHHKKELDLLHQLVVGANRIEERRDKDRIYKQMRQGFLAPKMIRELVEATVDKGLSDDEVAYRFKLAYLDLMLAAEQHAAGPRKLFMHPNGTRRTWDDLLRPFVEDLLVLGLGAWELRRESDKDENGEETGESKPDAKLLEVHWLDSATLRPVLNEYGDYKGDVDPNENSWEQWIDNQRVGPGFRSCDIMTAMEFPQSDVIFRGYPISRVETLIDTLTLDARGDMATNKKYKREMYGKILMFKGVPGMSTQEDVDAYRAFYEQEFESTYKLPFLTAGKDGEIKTVDVTMNSATGDKHAVDQQKQFLVRICAAMDVPPFKLGITEDVNRATALASGDMSDEGLDSLLTLIETTITRAIVHDFGYDDIKASAGRASDDESETLDALQRELDMHLITVNEARLTRGKPPVEGGDQSLAYKKTFDEEKARADAQPDMGGFDEGVEGEGLEEPGDEMDPGAPEPINEEVPEPVETPLQ